MLKLLCEVRLKTVRARARTRAPWPDSITNNLVVGGCAGAKLAKINISHKDL